MKTAYPKIAVVCALVCLLAGCEPPGKPNAEDAQAENRQNITDFRTLFSSNCAGCHGEAGKNGPARILNDALYLSVIPKDTLRNVVASGRPANGMPAWALSQGGPLTDKQVDALVNGIYSNWGKHGNLSGLPGYASTSNGDATAGKRLFVRNCFACHAKGGLVGPVTDPSYLQLVSDQMLRTSVIVGRPDLGMPDYRILNAGRPLSDQDVTDVVAYLISMRPASPDVNTGKENSSQRGVK